MIISLVLSEIKHLTPLGDWVRGNFSQFQGQRQKLGGSGQLPLEKSEKGVDFRLGDVY
jgi:hypothetical protein